VTPAIVPPSISGSFVSLPGRWLARLTFRRKLALIVGIPSAVALLGSLLAFGRVASNYQRARVLERANASSSYVIQAAAAQAKERGFAAAALSDPNAQVAQQEIGGLRADGDRLLEEALQEARLCLAGNPVLSASYGKLLAALHERDSARKQVDAALGRPGRQPADQTLVQSWFDAQTRLIEAERAFGRALFLAQNSYEMIIQYNGSIKANVFGASEFAGRERARIGRCIASGKPIAPDSLEELQRWRGVVEENLAAIAQLRANPAMSEPVLASIDHMEAVFLGDYQKARVSVYTASALRKPYPLTTDQWIATSTRGIDSILAVSDRIGEEAARISRAQAAFSLANVLLIIGMMAMLALAVVASVFVARHLTRRLGELRAAAERVSMGNFSEPIAGAGAAGRLGDEFAALATVFNAMQARVQAGIGQLQAEKAGVEAKVRERTRELSESNQKLAALNAEKDTFLGICSHDLKNPLNGIIGLSELLGDEAGDAGIVRSYSADILQSAEFMLHLVTNLLDIGAIEQGKFNLAPERLDLKALVVSGAENYRRRAADKRIELTISAPAGEVLVFADARAALQIVDNLVSNAIKFTPAGGSVTVGIHGPEAEAQAGFEVRDTGPGLSAEDQGRLFQKYSRLAPQATGGENSTGLGLSIVKRLIEAMDGTVTCRSGPGLGCTFAVTLPSR
jgi:signal transduction histidine kinase